MRYPDELVKRIKKEFPNEPYVHQLAESGSKDLPVMMKPRLVNLTPGEILEYLRGGQVDELRNRCELYKRRWDLYNEACRLAFGASSVF